MSPSQQMQEALNDFVDVARLADEPIQDSDLSFEYLPLPHVPPSRLPAGKMAIYAFWSNGNWLKIGKVGANSGPRYTSQHYNAGSARSTLAGSLLKCPELGAAFQGRADLVRDWIKANCARTNILVPSNRSPEMLALLEAFLHAKLKPRYER